jgi:hypothetical protein
VIGTATKWQPLERILRAVECGEFMYMGNVGAIHRYKHIETRRYLNLDSEGRCYAWTGNGEEYTPADLSEQLRRVRGIKS